MIKVEKLNSQINIPLPIEYYHLGNSINNTNGMNPIEGKLYSPFLKETTVPHVKKDNSSRGFGFYMERRHQWERNDATVNKIRITDGYPVKSFRILIDEVAIVTLRNKNYEMFYRGQNLDYRDSRGVFYKDKTPRTVVYPTICRPEKNADSSYKMSIKKTQIEKRYSNLQKLMALAGNKYNYYDEYLLSLFQHYDILPTPLIDITQSLRTAATFALRNTTTGYLYVFGLPFPNGSVSHFYDQGIVLVKLQNVSPVDAYRPRYQEGYLVGKYPITPTKEAADNLARRLVAKFYLDNTDNTFWDDNFLPMPENLLYPEDDPFKEKLIQLKQEFTAS